MSRERPEPFQMMPVTGWNYKSWRYRQGKDKQAEAKMLRRRLSARDHWTNCKLDTEAFYVSMMMLDCYLNERVKL